MNYHEILGVSPDASQEEIKKAYRSKAMSTHPDRGGNEEEFKKVNEAYSVLSGKQDGMPNNEPFDISEVLRGFGFGFHTGAQHYRKQRPPSSDAFIGGNFPINIEEMKQGKTFNISYEKSKDCVDCNGIGGKSKTSCVPCHGTGTVQSHRKHGQMTYVQTLPCKDCQTRGFTIVEPCNTCNGDGYTVYEENLNVMIKGNVV